MEEEGISEEYKKRIDCTLKLMGYCFDLLEYNAKKRFEERSLESFEGDLELKHDVTSIGYFDEINKNAWPIDMQQMMKLEANEYLLNQYRKCSMPVDTIYIKIGSEIIARTIIPCGQEEPCKPMNQ